MQIRVTVVPFQITAYYLLNDDQLVQYRAWKGTTWFLYGQGL